MVAAMALSVRKDSTDVDDGFSSITTAVTGSVVIVVAAMPATPVQLYNWKFSKQGAYVAGEEKTKGEKMGNELWLLS
jgi:hypothetical protein